MQTDTRALRILLLTAAASLAGCSSTSKLPPVQTATQVDLERFMGDWYVVANIPTFLEKDACNAVESYELLDDGRIATTFSFNAGGCDGPRKTYHPVGYVYDQESNAVWGMQFFWPFKADYRVMYVDPEYTRTVIGRNQRDYVWIMARTPSLADEHLNELVQMLAAQGYDTDQIEPVTQQWPDTDRGATQP